MLSRFVCFLISPRLQGRQSARQRPAAEAEAEAEVEAAVLTSPSECGHKGATIQHPGWGGENVGFLPFPTRPTVVTAS